MTTDQGNQPDRIRQLKTFFQNLKGQQPDYENLEQPDPDKTEAQYAAEQRRWLEGVRQQKETVFPVIPIGYVRKSETKTWLQIKPAFREGLLGLEGFSHIQVLFWFHENDTPEGRSAMRVHPRKDPKNPLTGVFATHSPLRPNLIGSTCCRIVRVTGTTIEIASIDAWDRSPVLDIKCYIPDAAEKGTFVVPDWV